MILLIDDLRSFRHEVVSGIEVPIFTARTSEEALTWLNGFIHMHGNTTLPIDQLWLDHDLGMIPNRGRTSGKEDIEDTTIPFVQELIKLHDEGNHVSINSVIVHSSNPVGVRNIMNKLRPIYPNITQVDAQQYFIV